MRSGRRARREVPQRGRSYRQHEWSKKVRKRDGCCVVCGAVDELHAHHVKPYATHPELAFDLENGRTLCRKHHREQHPELPSHLFGMAA